MHAVKKNIADKIIACDGWFGAQPEPPIVKIIEYDNPFQGTMYGLIAKGDDLNMYQANAYLRNPRIYWELS